MRSDHLINLSRVLFEELLKQFQNIDAFLRCPTDSVVGYISEVQFINNEFIRLLRHCLMMLQFLGFDTGLLWQKCTVLVKILENVCPQSLLLDSHECDTVTTKSSFLLCRSSFYGEINEVSDQLVNFFSLILEVFIAEFSENVTLRKHLFLFNVLTPNSEKLYSCHNTQTDNYTLLELVSSHFLLSIKHGLAVRRFFHSLSSSSDFKVMTPAISLDASLKLISTPLMLSVPCILQAHLILLTSRCISIHLCMDARKPDTPMMSCYLDPFDLSVKLYLSYLSTLQHDVAILGDNVRLNIGVIEPLYASTVHKMTCDKLSHRLNDFVALPHLQSEGTTLFATNSEVLAYFTAYVRGDHPLIDHLSKEATCLVVDYIVESILPKKLRELGQNKSKEKLPVEVYCLAAAMNLMNSSLLHIIWHSTQSHDEMQMLRDRLPCNAYERLSQSASILRVSVLGAEEQVQTFFGDMFRTYGGMHMELKFMLAHISSLLVFSFKRNLEFLCKGCISMMMTLMSLLLFEERNLETSKIFKLLQSDTKMDDNGLTYSGTSLRIATNMEKTRMLYSKIKDKYGHVMESRPNASESREVGQQSGSGTAEGIHESTVCVTQENTCSGKPFAECIRSFHTNPLEWENLVDFIECRSGKDYSAWLKNLSKFNMWKEEKTALSKCQKRKTPFGVVKKHNLRARIGAQRRAEESSEVRKSTTSCEECIENQGPQENRAQTSVANHEHRTELKVVGKPIDCSVENDKRGEAKILKKRVKRKVVVVSKYNLRPRVKTNKAN